MLGGERGDRRGNWMRWRHIDILTTHWDADVNKRPKLCASFELGRGGKSERELDVRREVPGLSDPERL